MYPSSINIIYSRQVHLPMSYSSSRGGRIQQPGAYAAFDGYSSVLQQVRPGDGSQAGGGGLIGKMPSAVRNGSRSLPRLDQMGSPELQPGRESYQESLPSTSPVVTPVVLGQIPLEMAPWNEILLSHDVYVLYIWKMSCAPCLSVANEYPRLASYFSQQADKAGNVRIGFGKDQIDECQDKPTSPSYAHWRVCEAVPMFLVYKRGKLFGQVTGFDKKELIPLIHRAIDEVHQENPISSPPSYEWPVGETERIEESPSVVYYKPI